MHFFSKVNALLGRSDTFYLINVGWQSVSSSCKITRLLESLAFQPGIFRFYKVHSPKPWIFNFSGFSAVFVLNNLSRTPLNFWGFFRLFRLSKVFRGRSKVFWWNWGIFLLNLVLSIRSDILGGLPLVSLLPRTFSRYWMAEFSWVRLGPVVPFWKGLRSFGGTISKLRATSLEVFSLPSGIVFPWQIRYFLCWVRDVKTEVN